MNRRQRERNRATAAALSAAVRKQADLAHTCENCGQPGGHWVQVQGATLQALLEGRDDQQGFYTCLRAKEPSLRPEGMVRGGRYNWINQPERLIYLGRWLYPDGYWYQFAKVETPDEVWCEVRQHQLDQFEETKP